MPNDEVLLESWLEQLVTGDFHHRWEVSKFLKAAPEAALKPLLELLTTADDDEELLWFIARLLGEIHHPDATASLVQLLQHSPSAEVQGAAAIALANRGPEAMPALQALLSPANHPPEIRQLAVQVLAQMDSPAVIDGLLTIVGDEVAAIRAVALEALGGFGDARIAPVLLAALQDSHSAVRCAAVRAIGARAHQLPGVALDEAIAPLLQDLHPPVMAQAAIALGRLDTESARSALATVLEPAANRPLALQIQAAQALGWSQSPAAIALLAESLGRSLLVLQRETSPELAATEIAADTAADLAQEIISVLGRLHPPQARALAAQALESLLPQIFDLGAAHGRLRSAAVWAIGQLSQPQSFEALWPYLGDPSPGVRLHVVAALRRLDPEGGRQRLQTLHNQFSGAFSGADDLAEGLAIACSEWEAAPTHDT